MTWLSRMTLVAAIAALAPSGAMAASGTVSTEPPMVAAAVSPSTQRTGAGPAATGDEAKELAAREQQANAKGLPEFEGGDGVGIYIGGGALTVALLIVLLVILL